MQRIIQELPQPATLTSFRTAPIEFEKVPHIHTYSHKYMHHGFLHHTHRVREVVAFMKMYTYADISCVVSAHACMHTYIYTVTCGLSTLHANHAIPPHFPPSKHVIIEIFYFFQDDDTNFHIDYITACSNLRATNYNIDIADRYAKRLVSSKLLRTCVYVCMVFLHHCIFMTTIQKLHTHTHEYTHT
jgi:hypothetical protein